MLQVAAENSVAVHMYEKCGYRVISRTADHPLHWIMRHVLKSFLGYPDWNMMAKQLMTSKDSKANFSPVRVPTSISATAGTAASKSAIAANAKQHGAAIAAGRSKPRLVFSFSNASPSPTAPPSWVMDVGDDDEEDRILAAACAAGESAEQARLGNFSARRSQTLSTIEELVNEDEEDGAWEAASATLPRRSALTKLPSFRVVNAPAGPAKRAHNGRHRPLVRTNTM